jgi:peptide/nickel transport system ATP-binding protein/oligopeptide transport system ATP-binding protein
MTPPVISARGLAKTFRGEHRRVIRAVDDVSFDIAAGETLALVGESGCGKSTTGRLLLRLIEPTAGQVFCGETELTALSAAAMRRMRRHLQMVFQDPMGSLSPRRTIGQTLAEPFEVHGVAKAAACQDRVAALLQQVGLSPEHADRYPGEFSGGQRQRIGIARAIALNPKLIVADEPVSALDVSVQAQIVNLLQDLQEQTRVAYLFIAHDLAVVRHIADRVAVMYLGRIVEIGSKAAVYDSPRHPYTQALLSAVLEPEPERTTTRIILRGDVPSPSALPPGCAFQTRCPIAEPRCRVERPELRAAASGQSVACHLADISPDATGSPGIAT